MLNWHSYILFTSGSKQLYCDKTNFNFYKSLTSIVDTPASYIEVWLQTFDYNS